VNSSYDAVLDCPVGPMPQPKIKAPVSIESPIYRGTAPLTALFVLFLVSGGWNALGNIYYVAKSGNDTNPGTSSLPFLTVQKGVNMAQAGDTVRVGPGTYGENVITARSAS